VPTPAGASSVGSKSVTPLCEVLQSYAPGSPHWPVKQFSVSAPSVHCVRAQKRPPHPAGTHIESERGAPLSVPLIFHFFAFDGFGRMLLNAHRPPWQVSDPGVPWQVPPCGQGRPWGLQKHWLEPVSQVGVQWPDTQDAPGPGQSAYVVQSIAGHSVSPVQVARLQNWMSEHSLFWVQAVFVTLPNSPRQIACSHWLTKRIRWPSQAGVGVGWAATARASERPITLTARMVLPRFRSIARSSCRLVGLEEHVVGQREFLKLDPDSACACCRTRAQRYLAGAASGELVRRAGTRGGADWRLSHLRPGSIAIGPMENAPSRRTPQRATVLLLDSLNPHRSIRTAAVSLRTPNLLRRPIGESPR